jgi:hypothetical protein
MYVSNQAAVHPQMLLYSVTFKQDIILKQLVLKCEQQRSGS